MGHCTQIRWALTLAIIALCDVWPSDGKKNMDIHRMLIQTRVTSRFARTFITTELQNPSNSSQEAVFDIELPKTAFISSFSMTVDNVTTVGRVKEKSEAKRTYEKAVSRGQSAGLVQSSGRKMEHFRMSVTVGPLAEATFNLTYEELLKRQLGNYELNLRVKPQGLVDNFQILVDIIEPQGISFLKAVGTFISNELADIVQINRTERKAHIEFKPTLSQQRTCPTCVDTYLDGELMIKYDVKRENSAGKLQVVNGYFVHYFAPPNLQRIPKNVVFVIDRSGSMYGNKIKQTYEAFIKILEDVPKEDYFAILTFDDKVEKWRKQMVRAVPENIQKAKEFVSQITARGGTDINKALLTTAKMLTNATFNNMLPEVSVSIIIFLSDGEPTSGTTNHDKIIDNVKKSLEGRASLYCLGFGNDVDFPFLEKLALQNGGLARRIYEDSDSALQLQGFYNEVAYPMLLDIHLQYVDNSVDHLTQNSFKHYFQGSEIIVAGCITNNSLEVLTAEVTAKGVLEPFSVKLESKVNEEEEAEKEQLYIFGDFTARLWAYLTIEQLMTRQISLAGEEKQKVMDQALNLSLKYNFVTPLTSLVVTKPEEEETNKHLVANKPKEDLKDDEFEDSPAMRLSASIQQNLDSHYYVGYDSPAYDEEEFLATASNVQDAGVYLTVVESLPFAPKMVTMETLATDSAEVMESLPLAPVLVTMETLATDSAKDHCNAFHVLLREPKASERICLHIAQDDDAHINLLHDASTGVTLIGRLLGQRSFGKFGLLNSKLGVKVEIAEHSVAVAQNSHVKAYHWNSSFELDGFLQKDGERIAVRIKDGVSFAIFRMDQSFRLSVSVEDQHSPTNLTSGVIGQLLNNNKTSFHMNTFAAGDQIFPFQSLTDCDLTPYGAEERGSCLFTSLHTNDLITASSYIVSDIFTGP